ncbi:MAG: restriction endonuclease subunit S [Terrimicrobiaceae bacterium]
MKWSQANLGEVSLLGPQYGANAPAIERSGKRSRYVRITDISSNGRLLSTGDVEADLTDETEFKLQEGDLLFARSGNTVGKTYCYDPDDGPCVFAGYLIRFRLNQELMHRRFAFYFTQSASYQNWLLTKRRVAGQPNINGKEYASLKVPLPPLSEQRQIVELLDQADALCCRRADADSIAERVLPALFRKIFDQPENNRDWPFAKLGDVTAIEAPMVDPRKPEFHALPHIGPDRISRRNGRILPAQTAKQDGLISGKFLFDQHHVLYSKIRPYLRKVALPESRGLCSADMYPVTPLAEYATREYIWALLLSDSFTNFTTEHSGRASIPKVNREQFAAYVFKLPPMPIQREFSNMTAQLRKLATQQESTRDTIDILFQTLLHRAFTGALTAGWRKAHMKELLAEMEQQARHLNTSGVVT